MPTRQELETALINADKAGDIEAATILANAIKSNSFSGRADIKSQVNEGSKDAIETIGSSAWQLAKDITYPFFNPIQTGEALLNLGRGVVEYAIPGEQEHEKYPDAVGQAIKGRYGSLGSIKNTALTDPVGMMADASAIVTGGGLLGGSKALTQAGKAVDPINLSINAVKYPASKLIPENLPSNMYESSAKFRPSLDPNKRRAMVNTALEEGIMPTSKGIGKIDDAIDELNTNINHLIDASTRSGERVPKSMIYQFLDDTRGKLGGVKANAPRDLAVMKRTVNKLDDYLNEIDKDYLTPRELQELKVSIYKDINYDSAKMRGTKAAEETNKDIARAAKVEIEKKIPEIKDLNKREGALLELKPELERSANRIENRDLLGIGAPLKIGAGSSVGGIPGSVIGAGSWLMDNPQLKAKIALDMYKAQQLGLLGHFMDNGTLPFMIRQGLLQSGRLAQEN